jgi:CPA1 family monovalent cation:H+ antiporter
VGLAGDGWRSVDCALLAAMTSATDAVAVAAILKGGGAPELLSVLLEGESLFNDASSIVLFEVRAAVSCVST